MGKFHASHGDDIGFGCKPHVELIAVSRIAPGCQQINVKFAQQSMGGMRDGMLPVRFGFLKKHPRRCIACERRCLL